MTAENESSEPHSHQNQPPFTDEALEQLLNTLDDRLDGDVLHVDEQGVPVEEMIAEHTRRLDQKRYPTTKDFDPYEDIKKLLTPGFTRGIAIAYDIPDFMPEILQVVLNFATENGLGLVFFNQGLPEDVTLPDILPNGFPCSEMIDLADETTSVEEIYQQFQMITDLPEAIDLTGKRRHYFIVVLHNILKTSKIRQKERNPRIVHLALTVAQELAYSKTFTRLSRLQEYKLPAELHQKVLQLGNNQSPDTRVFDAIILV